MNGEVPSLADDVFVPPVSGKIHLLKETNIFDNKGDYKKKDDILTRPYHKMEYVEARTVECDCNKIYYYDVPNIETLHFMADPQYVRSTIRKHITDPFCELCKGTKRYISIDTLNYHIPFFPKNKEEHECYKDLEYIQAVLKDFRVLKLPVPHKDVLDLERMIYSIPIKEYQLEARKLLNFERSKWK